MCQFVWYRETLYDGGNRIYSIVRGTVPIALIGSVRYPVLVRRLTRLGLIVQALAPPFSVGRSKIRPRGGVNPGHSSFTKPGELIFETIFGANTYANAITEL